MVSPTVAHSLVPLIGGVRISHGCLSSGGPALTGTPPPELRIGVRHSNICVTSDPPGTAEVDSAERSTISQHDATVRA